MLLGFNKTFLGQKTWFKEKILLSIPPRLWRVEHVYEIAGYSEFLHQLPNLNDGIIIPKPHSIRIGKRWKKDTIIHFCYGMRTPNYDNWLKYKVVDVQDFCIRYTMEKNIVNKIRVLIDGRSVPRETVWSLALNDGFPIRSHEPSDAIDEFLNFFFGQASKDSITDSFDFNGQIIHWTNLKYHDIR